MMKKDDLVESLSNLKHDMANKVMVFEHRIKKIAPHLESTADGMEHLAKLQYLLGEWKRQTEDLAQIKGKLQSDNEVM